MGINTNILQKRVSSKHVLRLTLILSLILSFIFVWLYVSRNDMMEVLENKINLGPEKPPKYLFTIYGNGLDGQLKKPMDVTVIGNLIYVTDTFKQRVQIFDYDGQAVGKFGKKGTGPGEFRFPYGIAGDSKGQVYVADLYNGVVSVFNQKEEFLYYFAEKKPNEKTIEQPAGITIKNDLVYVVDVKKNVISVFDLQGKLLLQFGKFGSNPGEFRSPNYVQVDNTGKIYVVDSGNDRVEVFDKTGKFIRQFNGSDTNQATAFLNPRGIGIDGRNTIYVVSKITDQVFGFDENGKKLFSFGTKGADDEQMNLPNGLFIDTQGRIYLVDSANNRIVVYKNQD